MNSFNPNKQEAKGIVALGFLLVLHEILVVGIFKKLHWELFITHQESRKPGRIQEPKLKHCVLQLAKLAEKRKWIEKCDCIGKFAPILHYINAPQCPTYNCGGALGCVDRIQNRNVALVKSATCQIAMSKDETW